MKLKSKKEILELGVAGIKNFYDIEYSKSGNTLSVEVKRDVICDFVKVGRSPKFLKKMNFVRTSQPKKNAKLFETLEMYRRSFLEVEMGSVHLHNELIFKIFNSVWDIISKDSSILYLNVSAKNVPLTSIEFDDKLGYFKIIDIRRALLLRKNAGKY